MKKHWLDRDDTTRMVSDRMWADMESDPDAIMCDSCQVVCHIDEVDEIEDEKLICRYCQKHLAKEVN